MTTGQARRAARSGATRKRLNAACRHFLPARRVATCLPLPGRPGRGSRPLAAASGSTVVADTLFAARRLGSDAVLRDRDAIPVRNAG